MRLFPIASFLVLALPANSGAQPCQQLPEPEIVALSVAVNAAEAASAEPDLPNTPNPKKFADAWGARFAEVAQAAAGADGRMSRSEAWRIRELDGWEALFSDDALGILMESGQQTMVIGKLATLATERALASAVEAAGDDGRLSLPDGKERLLPQLRDDFLWLRGKLVLPASRTPEELAEVVRSQVLLALDEETATYLGAPPDAVRGRRPVISRLDHPASETWGDVYIADGEVYFSRAASGPPPVPLVGWWHIGPVPDRE